YLRQAAHLPISPLNTRRRISAHCSMLVYTLEPRCIRAQWNGPKTAIVAVIQRVVPKALRFPTARSAAPTDTFSVRRLYTTPPFSEGYEESPVVNRPTDQRRGP